MLRDTLHRHWKFIALVDRLKLPRPYVLGLLQTMWLGPDSSGCDELGDRRGVEQAADWPGEPGVFAEAVIAVRFVDEDKASGVCRVHDYLQHAPEHILRRAAREASRSARGLTISAIRAEAGRRGGVRSGETRRRLSKLGRNEAKGSKKTPFASRPGSNEAKRSKTREAPQASANGINTFEANGATHTRARRSTSLEGIYPPLSRREGGAGAPQAPDGAPSPGDRNERGWEPAPLPAALARMSIRGYLSGSIPRLAGCATLGELWAERWRRVPRRDRPTEDGQQVQQVVLRWIVEAHGIGGAVRAIEHAVARGWRNFERSWLERDVFDGGRPPQPRPTGPDLQASGRVAQVPAIDVPSALAGLAAALPPDLPDGEAWRQRVLSLRGESETVEQALAQIDSELVTCMLALSEPAVIEERVQTALRSLIHQLGAAELAAARRAMEAQVVRQRWRLPVLSLFSGPGPG